MNEDQDIKYKVETFRQFFKEHSEVLLPALHGYDLDDPEGGKKAWLHFEDIWKNAPGRSLEPIISLAPKLFARSGRPDLHNLLLSILKKTYDMGPDMENMPVVQSNHLIMAQYKLSKLAQQTLRTLIAMVKPDQTHFVGQMYRLGITEFGRLLNRKDSHGLTEEILEVAKELRRTPIIIKEGKRICETSWIQMYDFDYGTGFIDFQFSYLLGKYLLQLQQSFTEYRLENIPQLKHKHTIRIYELLRQYLSIGVREIALDDLKEMLKVEHSYADLRKKILEPAHEEINSLTDIRYDWEAVVGTRKRIGKIRFINIRSVMPVSEPKPEQAPVVAPKPKPAPVPAEPEPRAKIQDELTPKIDEIMDDPEHETYQKCSQIVRRNVQDISPASLIFREILRGHVREELKAR